MTTVAKQELQCRAASFTDLVRIAEIEAEVFAEPYLFLMLRQLWDLHGEDWIVGEVEGQVIGYALMLCRQPRALLFTFAVRRGFQRRGHGERLLAEALDRCRSVGIETVQLTVRPGNDGASRMFKRAGFEFREHHENYFGAGESRDVLELAMN